MTRTNRTLQGISMILVTPLLLFAPAPALAQGVVTGRVLFDGPRPDPVVQTINSDRDACGPSVTTTPVDGTQGGVRYAVVRLLGIGADEVPAFEEPILDQNGCVFTPPVVLVGPGQDLLVLNNDGIMHNVHTTPEVNRGVNKSMPKFLTKMNVSFREPEFVPVRCDVHGWMKAHIVVAEHRHYAVSAEDGSFTLEGVPAGTHMLEVWHPTLGTVKSSVEVVVGGTSQLDISYGTSTGPRPQEGREP